LTLPLFNITNNTSFSEREGGEAMAVKEEEWRKSTFHERYGN